MHWILEVFTVLRFWCSSQQMYLNASEHFANSHNVFPTIPQATGERTWTQHSHGIAVRWASGQIHCKSTPPRHGRVFSGFPSVENKLFGAPGTPPPFPPASAGPAECSSLIRVSVLVTKDWCLSVNSQAALFLIPHYCFSPPLYLTDPYLPPPSSSPLLVGPPPPTASAVPSPGDIHSSRGASRRHLQVIVSIWAPSPKSHQHHLIKLREGARRANPISSLSDARTCVRASREEHYGVHCCNTQSDASAISACTNALSVFSSTRTHTQPFCHFTTHLHHIAVTASPVA